VIISAPVLEKLTWALLYGGLLAAGLGLFVEKQDFAFGWSLVVGGGIAAAAGGVLIWVRSRIKDPL
jgi:hypothetical protein